MSSMREAKTRLLTELNALSVPPLSPSASADEIGNLRDHFDGFVAAVDRYVLAIGQELSRACPESFVLLHLFTDKLREATDGLGRYEFEAVTEELRKLAAEAA